MSALPKAIATRLASEFADKEYAHAYMEEHAISRIAAQVFALRQQRGWTQKELAHKAHIAQERISKIESADFDSLTMKTLQKLADAFDVTAHIGFQSFADAILDVVNLNNERLRVPDRKESLENFCNSRILECGDGWKSIDRDRLATVKDFVPRAPVDPTPALGWQRLHHG